MNPGETRVRHQDLTIYEGLNPQNDYPGIAISPILIVNALLFISLGSDSNNMKLRIENPQKQKWCLPGPKRILSTHIKITFKFSVHQDDEQNRILLVARSPNASL